MIPLYLFILPICTIHQFNVAFRRVVMVERSGHQSSIINPNIDSAIVAQCRKQQSAGSISIVFESNRISINWWPTLSRHCSLSTVKLNGIENEFKFYVRRYLDEISVRFITRNHKLHPCGNRSFFLKNPSWKCSCFCYGLSLINS